DNGLAGRSIASSSRPLQIEGMNHLPRKLAPVSGIAILGEISHQASWYFDECLILRFLGPMSGAQMGLFRQYQTRTKPLRLRLPDRADSSVSIVGFDAEQRTFFLTVLPADAPCATA